MGSMRVNSVNINRSNISVPLITISEVEMSMSFCSRDKEILERMSVERRQQRVVGYPEKRETNEKIGAERPKDRCAVKRGRGSMTSL